MGGKKCLFLDRDGVINLDLGDYVYEKDKFKILPTVFPVLKELQKRGFCFIIITNQGGVAKGFYTEKDVIKLHNFMCEQFKNEDIQIIDIFYSLHHNIISNSIDRKPDSLMIEKAIYLHNIDVKKSYFIGDKQSDIDAAQKVNIKGFKVDKNTSLLFLLDEIS